MPLFPKSSATISANCLSISFGEKLHPHRRVTGAPLFTFFLIWVKGMKFSWPQFGQENLGRLAMPDCTRAPYDYGVPKKKKQPTAKPEWPFFRTYASRRTTESLACLLRGSRSTHQFRKQHRLEGCK